MLNVAVSSQKSFTTEIKPVPVTYVRSRMALTSIEFGYRYQSTRAYRYPVKAYSDYATIYMSDQELMPKN